MNTKDEIAYTLAHHESRRDAEVRDVRQLDALGRAFLSPEDARALRLREAGMGSVWPSCEDHYAD